VDLLSAKLRLLREKRGSTAMSLKMMMLLTKTRTTRTTHLVMIATVMRRGVMRMMRIVMRMMMIVMMMRMMIVMMIEMMRIISRREREDDV